MSVIQTNNEENRSLCCRAISHPGTQAAVSLASTAGSVTTGLLMMTGAIAVNAIPIAGQAICIALVAIWIIGSLVSYYHAINRWENQAAEEAFRERDIQILHPQPQPSDVEMVPFETTAGETSTGEEEEVPGESPRFMSPNYERQRTDAQNEPVSLEMTSVPRKPYVRQLPMPHMITFADLHASIGEEIRRNTAAAADQESDGEQPGLDSTGVVIEDVTEEEPTDREPLYFPQSQERTPAHLSLVPFHFQQALPIIECPATPRESDNWMLVPFASPRADGPRVVEITEEEFQALKEREAIQEGLAARKERGGANAHPVEQSSPASEKTAISVKPETLAARALLAAVTKEREERARQPIVEPAPVQAPPVNPDTLASRELLAQCEKDRAARAKQQTIAPAQVPAASVNAATLGSRGPLRDLTEQREDSGSPLLDTTHEIILEERPESPLPRTSCGRLQQKAWDVLATGQNLLNRGLGRLPSWVLVLRE